MSDYYDRYRAATQHAQAAEAEIVRLRAKLAEATKLADDCIVAIATLDTRHNEVERPDLVVVVLA